MTDTDRRMAYFLLLSLLCGLAGGFFGYAVGASAQYMAGGVGIGLVAPAFVMAVLGIVMNMRRRRDNDH